MPDEFRAQALCESRGGRPGLPVPDSPYGLCGRKATLNLNSLSPQSSGAHLFLLFVNNNNNDNNNNNRELSAFGDSKRFTA